MRIRFKLKTLLLLTLFAAIITALYGNLVIQANAERRAIAALKEEWMVVTDLGNVNLKRDNRLRRYLTWPIRMWLGDDSVARCRELKLYAPDDSPKTKLGNLRRFKQLESLVLAYSPATCVYMNISNSDMQHVAALVNLKKLRIAKGNITNEGLAHLTRLKLTDLSCGGGDRWGRAELTTISKIESLTSLTLDNVTLDVEPLSSLPMLKALVVRIEPQTNLKPIVDIPQLETLFLLGEIGPEQITALHGAKKLSWLHLDTANVDDSSVDALLDLTALKHVSVGWMQISVDSFNKLTESGLEVHHNGLAGIELNSNLFRYKGMTTDLDVSKCRLTACIDEGNPDIHWRIEAVSTVKYLPSNSSPWTFESPPFVWNDDWREMDGHKTPISLPVNSTEEHFYDGVYHGTYNNYVEVISREGNVFHLRWQFYSRMDGEKGYGLVDGMFEFGAVVISSSKKMTVEIAKKRLGDHFDLEAFHEPAMSKNPQSTIFEFKLKSTRVEGGRTKLGQ